MKKLSKAFCGTRQNYRKSDTLFQVMTFESKVGAEDYRLENGKGRVVLESLKVITSVTLAA